MMLNIRNNQAGREKLRNPHATVLAGAAALLLLLALSLSAGCTTGQQPGGESSAGQGSASSANSDSTGAAEGGAQGDATSAATPAPGEQVKEGDTAPDFSFAALDGTVSSLAELKGEVVLLNFWASWCPPCVAEMPDIERLREAYPSLKVLAVSLDVDEAEMRAFIEESDYGFAWIHDVGYRIANLYPESAIPYTIIIDRDGVITATFLGSPRDPFATYESALQAAGI
ncbi:MAG: TlpA family protein disulfide reductase [Coriobacteriales bacterium]|jgi:thiol-disulfide isomerase/thioredoxin|nr:TlpA family protein disulfide reductase [Coriobacteriales bacterium]